MTLVRPSVENIRSVGNFTQAFRWIVHLAELPSAVAAVATSEDLNFRAESSSIPTRTSTPTEITIRGNTVRQAGMMVYNSPLTIGANETIDSKLSELIRTWQDLAWESKEGSSGKTAPVEELQGRIELIRLDQADNPIYKYTLFGAWLESAEKGDLDGSTADPLKPQLGIAFDRFEEGKI